MFNELKGTKQCNRNEGLKSVKVKAEADLKPSRVSMLEIFVNIVVVRCEIWYYLYNLKNLKSTHGGALILVKLKACNFTKINTPLWVFFMFFKLYKQYQIAQRTAVNDVQLILQKYSVIDIRLGCDEPLKRSKC